MRYLGNIYCILHRLCHWRMQFKGTIACAVSSGACAVTSSSAQSNSWSPWPQKEDGWRWTQPTVGTTQASFAGKSHYAFIVAGKKRRGGILAFTSSLRSEKLILAVWWDISLLYVGRSISSVSSPRWSQVNLHAAGLICQRLVNHAPEFSWWVSVQEVVDTDPEQTWHHTSGEKSKWNHCQGEQCDM